MLQTSEVLVIEYGRKIHLDTVVKPNILIIHNNSRREMTVVESTYIYLSELLSKGSTTLVSFIYDHVMEPVTCLEA